MDMPEINTIWKGTLVDKEKYEQRIAELEGRIAAMHVDYNTIRLSLEQADEERDRLEKQRDNYFAIATERALRIAELETVIENITAEMGE